MTFKINEHKLKVAKTEIRKTEASYLPFPEQSSVKFDKDALLPVGLISFNKFDSSSEQSVLIAIPTAQGTFDGDDPYITYSLVGDTWQVDDEYEDALENELADDYLEKFEEVVQAYRAKDQSDNVEEGADEPFFYMGGQPPLGQNWSAELYDERAENPELDAYRDAMRKEEGEAFDDMSTREITYIDEEIDKEYIFLGWFSYDLYIDSGGECMVFYQPELKKVMVVAEFS